MNFSFKLFLALVFLFALNSCRSTKKLQTAVNKKDTSVIIPPKTIDADSMNIASEVFNSLEKNRIDFKTFSAKAKVDYEDHNGKQPDFNAFIRLKKDSILWISINATFLGIEAFRILITPESIVIINKLDKAVETHPFSFIESVAHIPLSFSTLQDLIIGNPVFLGDSIVTFKRAGSYFLMGTIGKFFKNLLTVSFDNNLLKSKLDDIGMEKNRTAALTYDNYQKSERVTFATERQITVVEKTKVDIKLSFKQFEFNKELSFPFTIPRNFKTK
jgi:hypothetical protein